MLRAIRTGGWPSACACYPRPLGLDEDSCGIIFSSAMEVANARAAHHLVDHDWLGKGEAWYRNVAIKWNQVQFLLERKWI